MCNWNWEELKRVGDVLDKLQSGEYSVFTYDGKQFVVTRGK